MYNYMLFLGIKNKLIYSKHIYRLQLEKSGAAQQTLTNMVQLSVEITIF